MASIADRLNLRPDEFAFHFESDQGVEIDALAKFLKSAATIAKNHGGQLRAMGLQEGSLIVILRAIKNSKIARNAMKEIEDNPLDASVKITGLVGAIVGAIIFAISPMKHGETPIAKAGVAVIDKTGVTQISIVTNNHTEVIMDRAIAHELRGARLLSERLRHEKRLIAPGEDEEALPEQVTLMIEHARRGQLTGEVALVGDALHFRPDGYRFWVPIYLSSGTGETYLIPSSRYRLAGHIETLHGQPDRIVAQSADVISK